jgi:NAD(P)-dependent dehydrogenase (short-subunit alcohol dehydrogenase family)
MSERFSNQVVAVTGGADGIGAETSALFGEGGAQVIVADINALRGNACAKAIPECCFSANRCHSR